MKLGAACHLVEPTIFQLRAPWLAEDVARMDVADSFPPPKSSRSTHAALLGCFTALHTHVGRTLGSDRDGPDGICGGRGQEHFIKIHQLFISFRWARERMRQRERHRPIAPIPAIFSRRMQWDTARQTRVFPADIDYKHSSSKSLIRREPDSVSRSCQRPLGLQHVTIADLRFSRSVRQRPMTPYKLLTRG